MTTLERQNVRGALLAAGFRRTTSGDKKCHYDRKLNGAYTEEWTHAKDKSRLILKWDKKTRES